MEYLYCFVVDAMCVMSVCMTVVEKLIWDHCYCCCCSNLLVTIGLQGLRTSSFHHTIVFIKIAQIDTKAKKK